MSADLRPPLAQAMAEAEFIRVADRVARTCVVAAGLADASTIPWAGRVRLSRASDVLVRTETFAEEISWVLAVRDALFGASAALSDVRQALDLGDRLLALLLERLYLLPISA